MPLDQVVITYVRSSSWINVLLLRSMNLFQPVLVESPSVSELIEVSPNGFCWYEQNVEYRIMVNEVFDIGTKTNGGSVVEMQGSHVSFGLVLRRIRHRVLDELTINVKQGELPLRISPDVPCSLHCSNCANEIIGQRQYDQIREVPMTTMKPHNYFCPRNVYPSEEELYYGLNYLVVCFEVLGNGVTTTRGRRRVLCSRCKQCVGEIIGRDVGVQLYADTLRLVTSDSALEFKEIFGHVTPTQIMKRLMNDADTFDLEQTGLFLKAVRPDGQLQLLHMQMDTKQMHILRSELDVSDIVKPSADLSTEVDTSSESDMDMNLSDSSSSNSSAPETGNDKIATPPRPTTPKGTPPKTVQYVRMRGFRGCRVTYLFSGSDSDLIENHEVSMTWRERTRLLHISYTMMADLLGELNANENMLASLEKTSPPVKTYNPRHSYIIFEPDEEFYARQERFARIS
ncbi:uncharacterized protein LOC6553983 [Drosophila erecta]|uniref:GG18739 n=1 Tax=Drosophila erecta TaxID=7220 RepID=B3P1D9_DROER|nr:uncharacterized protein LOC6553983 [Drosophila erecta]EDV49398.1 uncharacterized protein Dere_GG18739 [Drosophila erecta]